MIKKHAATFARFLPIIAFMSFFACATTKTTAPIYRVRVASGDSLASIAQRYGTSWNEIARLNHIRDYTSVKVGQEILVCPGPGGYVAKGTQAGSSFLGELSGEDLEHYLSKKQASAKDPQPESYELKDLDEEGIDQVNHSDHPNLSMSEIHMWPVNGSITSPFGPRGRRFHGGIDIRANKGTPIKASKAGKVIFSGRKRKYGKVVVLQHPDTGSKTLYAHCSKLLVKVNEWVDDGTVIAQVGATGNARGVHLHYEYRNPQGKLENPLTVLTRSPETDLLSFDSLTHFEELLDGMYDTTGADLVHNHQDDFSDEEDVFYTKG